MSMPCDGSLVFLIEIGGEEVMTPLNKHIYASKCSTMGTINSESELSYNYRSKNSFAVIINASTTVNSDRACRDTPTEKHFGRSKPVMCVPVRAIIYQK